MASSDPSCLCAIIILVVILICVLFCNAPEGLKGNQIYTAGATMRVIGSQFTGTNQGSYDIVYNDDIDTWDDYNKSVERMTTGGPGSGKTPSILKKRR